MNLALAGKEGEFANLHMFMNTWFRHIRHPGGELHLGTLGPLLDSDVYRILNMNTRDIFSQLEILAIDQEVSKT